MSIKSLLRKAKEGTQKEAWAAISELVKLSPSNQEEAKARAYACACLAEASFSRQKVGTAIDWWQEAVDCDPLNPEYRLSFVAHGLLPCGMNRQALNEVQRAINLDKTNPKAYRLLGHVETALNNTKEAVEAFDKFIELDKESPESLLDRNDLACDMGDWDLVKKNCDKMLEIQGEHTGNALHQLGLIAFRRGDHEKAIAIWDETLNHKCDNREGVLWNRSLPMLALGRYREGWRQHEARLINKSQSVMAYQCHRGRPDLMWNNEPPPARLHVSMEMGFGDAFAMARYLPILAEKGYDVRFEVMDCLYDVMQCLPGVKIAHRAPIYPDLVGVDEFDYHVPALSLPRLMGTTLETVPWNGPYIKADPKKVAEYRRKLSAPPTGPAVGFCWSAGIRNEHGLWLKEYGKRKSIDRDIIEPIVRAVDALGSLPISLCVGHDKHRLWEVLPEAPSFAETAALIECLDLVITVDTAVAHLAGAMGKPVWVLMHTEGSWHWLAERPNSPWNEKSPWYPTARLFRAKKPHEWDDVIDRVASELKTYFQKAA